MTLRQGEDGTEVQRLPRPELCPGCRLSATLRTHFCGSPRLKQTSTASIAKYLTPDTARKEMNVFNVLTVGVVGGARCQVVAVKGGHWWKTPAGVSSQDRVWGVGVLQAETHNDL